MRRGTDRQRLVTNINCGTSTTRAKCNKQPKTMLPHGGLLCWQWCSYLVVTNSDESTCEMKYSIGNKLAAEQLHEKWTTTSSNAASNMNNMNTSNLLQNTYIYTLYCFQVAIFQNQRIQPGNQTLQIWCHTSPTINVHSTFCNAQVVTLPRQWLRSIVMSASVCLTGYLRNPTRNLYEILCACCLCPWLGPPLAHWR